MYSESMTNRQGVSCIFTILITLTVVMEWEILFMEYELSEVGATHLFIHTIE